jgi:hypothetical protein
MILDKEQEVLYDALYEEVDLFMKKHNPCDIRDGKCTKGRKGYNSFCCSWCPELSDNGCIADKPLACRIWLCSVPLDTMSKELKKEYDILRKKVDHSGFWGNRVSKHKEKNGSVCIRENIKYVHF